MTDRFHSPSSFQANSRSPRRTDRQLSPTRYDIDFYHRKVERLEEDIIVISDQLNKARLRLRRAEDFQIKYDLIFKQKASVDEELIKKQRQNYQIRSKLEEVSLLFKEKASKTDQTNFEKISLLKEIQIWKQKAFENEEKFRLISLQEQNRASERVEHELISIRRTFTEAEEQYKFQIGRLSKQVQEKSSSENLLTEKYDKVRKEKDTEILRLEKIIQNNREALVQTIDEKNSEIMKVRNRFEQMFNDEINHLQKNLNSQDNRFGLELEGLKALIEMKNEEISTLQQEQKITLQEHSKEREELIYEIQLLREKIYEVEHNNEQELFNMKGRLSTLHSIDLETITSRYEELIDGLKKERQEQDHLVKDNNLKIEYERKQFERVRDDLEQHLKDRENIIQEVKEKHTDHGESSTNQINNLHSALTKIETDKSILTNQYQINIAFLNQQITKLINSNELKNNQIKQLHEFIALLKRQHFEIVKDLEGKWKSQRKQRQNQRQKQRDNRQKAEEEFRQSQRNWKNKEREFERDLEKEKRQKNKLQVNVQQLEKDLERLHKENNMLDECFKKQLNKNQMATIGHGGIRREITGEVEKQKVQLEALKRLEIDQIRKKYQLEITRLSHFSQRLQNELANKNLAYENLEEELKKISFQNKNMEKITKQKMVEYQKKMTALNSEILLTQNLYQSFIDAKSRVVRKNED